MEAEKLSLGGKTFVHIGSGPLRQDLFVMMHARHAGLVGAGMLEGESPEDYAARLLDLILMSGRALLLLGGLLIPEGKKPEDWTEEMAEETAGFLGGVVDPEEKKKVQGELLSVLLGFFVNGLGSWIASDRYSADDRRQVTSPKGDGGIGTVLSGASPITTPNAASGSSVG